MAVLLAEPGRTVNVRTRRKRMLRKAEKREAGGGEILANGINLESPTVPTLTPNSRFGLVCHALCGLTPQRVKAALIDKKIPYNILPRTQHVYKGQG